jgi:hypothetical protein
MTEANLQKAAARVLDLKGIVWTHVANERKTSPMHGRHLKMQGVKAGVPDILIFEPKGNFNGLALELKVGRNKLTPNQKEWEVKLGSCGWKFALCTTIDQVIEEVENYISQGAALKKGFNILNT